MSGPNPTKGRAPEQQSSAPETGRGARAAAGGVLYVTATPIGNLGDVTLRALDVLRDADLVACEDTRVTGKLLGHYGIKAALIAYHDHNAAHQRPKILAKLAEGGSVALVSDAGTPLVSDPGYKLVAEAAAAGHPVVPLPGASAPLAALAASGLPTDAFYFGGFLPPRSAARRKALEPLRPLRATLIFFEGPSRVAAALSDMAAVMGPREAAVAREITKVFEEFRRAPLADLAAAYAAEDPPRGEVVLLCGPPAAGGEAAGEDLDALLTEALATDRLKTAVERVTALTGLPRKTVYARALDLKDGGDR